MDTASIKDRESFMGRLQMIGFKNGVGGMRGEMETGVNHIVVFGPLCSATSIFGGFPSGHAAFIL